MAAMHHVLAEWYMIQNYISLIDHTTINLKLKVAIIVSLLQKYVTLLLLRIFSLLFLLLVMILLVLLVCHVFAVFWYEVWGNKIALRPTSTCTLCTSVMAATPYTAQTTLQYWQHNGITQCNALTLASLSMTNYVNESTPAWTNHNACTQSQKTLAVEYSSFIDFYCFFPLWVYWIIISLALQTSWLEEVNTLY